MVVFSESRRAANRASAARSRKRKQEYVKDLEFRNEQLTRICAFLMHQNQKMMEKRSAEGLEVSDCNFSQESLFMSTFTDGLGY